MTIDTKWEIGGFSFGCFGRCVSVGPQGTGWVPIPLVTKLHGMFIEHALQRSIRTFHHPIALGVVCGGVQLGGAQRCASCTTHWLARWSPDLIIVLLGLRTWGEPHQLEARQSYLSSGQVLGKPVAT